MKHTDDGTLSLFGDAPTPPPAATPQASPTAKKPRAKRKPKDTGELQQPSGPSAEAVTEAPPQTSQAEAPTAEAIAENTEVPNPIEATLHLANSLAPQPRRNSPWAGASAAASKVVLGVSATSTLGSAALRFARGFLGAAEGGTFSGS